MARVYTSMLKKDFGSFGQESYIWPPFECGDASDIYVGKGCNIKSGGWIMCVKSYSSVKFSPRINIGDGSSIGHRAHIIACLTMSIGKNVLIADNVYITDNLHGYEDISKSIDKQDLSTPGPVIIEDEVWLGENVCILPNVTIGRHSVVGSNSVVTKSIPEYSVAVGVPAKVIKRYNHGTGKWERV